MAVTSVLAETRASLPQRLDRVSGHIEIAVGAEQWAT
jgi:hypothetical protein